MIINGENKLKYYEQHFVSPWSAAFSFLGGVMTDPIYRVWFPQLFIEEEDESLVRAVEEIEAEERELQDD